MYVNHSRLSLLCHVRKSTNKSCGSLGFGVGAVVPKVGVVFTFLWGNSEVKLFGSQLIDRDNGQAGKGGSKERATIRL